MVIQADTQASLARPETRQEGTLRTQRLLAAGGVLAALAASSCCIVPLVLFGLGVSGAWIGNLTRLAPYQPYFLAATAACLGYGSWLVYRSGNRTCADGEVCARPLRTGLSKLASFLRHSSFSAH